MKPEERLTRLQLGQTETVVGTPVPRRALTLPPARPDGVNLPHEQARCLRGLRIASCSGAASVSSHRVHDADVAQLEKNTRLVEAGQIGQYARIQR